MREPYLQPAQTSCAIEIVCFGIFVVFVSLNKPFISDPLSSNRVNKAIQTFPGVPPHVAVVQSESELVNIPPDVLLAGMMINAMKPATEQREHAFDSVGCYTLAGVFPMLMIDRFVLVVLAEADIGQQFICMHR